MTAQQEVTLWLYHEFTPKKSIFTLWLKNKIFTAPWQAFLIKT
jgi:hypothetical protein